MPDNKCVEFLTILIDVALNPIHVIQRPVIWPRNEARVFLKHTRNYRTRAACRVFWGGTASDSICLGVLVGGTGGRPSRKMPCCGSTNDGDIVSAVVPGALHRTLRGSDTRRPQAHAMQSIR